MKMKPVIPVQKRDQSGSALFLTVIMAGIALATVAGVLSYSVNNARLNYRANQYQRAVAAAEGNTEKVVGMIARDFLSGGEVLVTANLAAYRQTTLSASDSAYWADWEFNDASGHAGQTFVQPGATSNYLVLNSTYAGLRGYVSEYTVVSDARQTPAPQDVVGGVLQQVQLVRIPIFQFMMYSTDDMEISCGQPFVITGRVHSNARLYIEPDDVMTFRSRVTAVRQILFQRSPNDSRVPPSGSWVFQVPRECPVPAMNLPIGTSNTPTAVREIIQPPPAFEDPNSAIGLQRLYNRSDMLLVVSDAGMSASSGGFNSFTTVIPTNELPLFVSTTNSFWDEREGKTVMPIDINIATFTPWCATNTSIRPALGGKDVFAIYILDRRTLPGTSLGAVRLVNGRQLPSRGLTVTTPRPLYVLGHYNQTNSAFLGTNDTSTTLPASILADAITILSTNWSDANSAAPVASRNARPTTVNAAILAGAVESAGGSYGGGMENFPRFLETWGLANAFTYNGSMVKMFPSLYATNMWGKSNVYKPPKRDWAYDINFENPEKLPPLAPSLQVVTRSQWATVAPNRTTAPAN
jgi:hypothetical protein